MKATLYLMLFSAFFLYAYASSSEVKDQEGDELQAKGREISNAADFVNDPDYYDELEADNDNQVDACNPHNYESRDQDEVVADFDDDLQLQNLDDVVDEEDALKDDLNDEKMESNDASFGGRRRFPGLKIASRRRSNNARRRWGW